MDRSTRAIRQQRRVMAYTAAAMYGFAAVDATIDGLLPGGQLSLPPVIGAIALGILLALSGARLPRMVVGISGPLGVGLMALALAAPSHSATPASTISGDVLFALPVLWQTLFFGRRGAALILGCVVSAQSAVQLALPPTYQSSSRIVDTSIACCAIALVVLWLEHRNEMLLTRLMGEARMDPLSGLLNRRGFDERVEIESARARRYPESQALVIFDIDHFKDVNDAWGHDVGDQVLRRIASLLGQHTRGADVAARFGGEEFVCLLPGADAAAGVAFADRVRASLAEPPPVGQPPVRMSAGVAASTESDVTELIRHADLALYEAKRSGRDRTCRFSPIAVPPMPQPRRKRTPQRL